MNHKLTYWLIYVWSGVSLYVLHVYLTHVILLMFIDTVRFCLNCVAYDRIMDRLYRYVDSSHIHFLKLNSDSSPNVSWFKVVMTKSTMDWYANGPIRVIFTNNNVILFKPYTKWLQRQASKLTSPFCTL